VRANVTAASYVIAEVGAADRVIADVGPARAAADVVVADVVTMAAMPYWDVYRIQ